MKSLYILLTAIINYLKNFKSTVTDGSTLSKNYVIFPNGLKMCWGFYDATTERYFDFPVVFTGYPYCLLTNRAYNDAGIELVYSAYRENGKMKVLAYNPETNKYDTTSAISFMYFVIGY